LPAVADEARRLQALAEAPDAAQPHLGEDLRALALINLGIAELVEARFEDAERRLEHGVTLAHRIGRPYLAFTGLAYQALCAIYGSFARSAGYSRQAIELAERHGWTDDPTAGIPCALIGTVLAWQGQLEEAQSWVQRAERTLSAEAGPTCATCTPSSARTGEPTPSPAPVPSACWHPPRTGARPRALADGASWLTAGGQAGSGRRAHRASRPAR
jgi:LuxR family maltose regulon positive regulatory protein